MARLIDEEQAFKVLSAYYKHNTQVQDSALHDALSRVPSADLVNEWCTDCKEYDQEQHCCHRFTKVIRQTQEELKQNAVPVKHGKFIGTEYDGYADGNPVYYEWKCSECGCVFEEEEPTYRYCPHCGARMDKG